MIDDKKLTEISDELLEMAAILFETQDMRANRKDDEAFFRDRGEEPPRPGDGFAMSLSRSDGNEWVASVRYRMIRTRNNLPGGDLIRGEPRKTIVAAFESLFDKTREELGGRVDTALKFTRRE